MFGVEVVDEGSEEERPEKRQRVAAECDDEEDELDKSGVFDDEPSGDSAEPRELPKASGSKDDQRLFSGDISGRGRGVVEPSEEGREVRVPRAPYVPTAKERCEHDATHYPLRSWCPHCVRGRGIAGPHLRQEDDRVGDVGELHFDYCFLRGRAGDVPATTLVGVDRYTQAVLAHVVPKKGTEFQWVAAQLDRDVKRFGYHGRLVVKSDQEPAVVDLMKELARRRLTAPTVLEKSKAYDSKSNGRAESTVRRVEEQVRTMKLALEDALKTELDVHHPVFSWMVQHAADIITKCAVGRDGRTPYERIKGKRYHGQLLEFGSVVQIKFQGKLHGGLLRERWGTGIWLGKRWSSDEHLVSINGKVARARDVRPVLEDQRFDREMLDPTGALALNDASSRRGVRQDF